MPAFSFYGRNLDRPWLGSVSNRVRLNGYLEINKSIRFETGYDLVPRIQDHLLFGQDLIFPDINPLSYRFDDFNRILFPDRNEIHSLAVYNNLDRAFVGLRVRWADIFIGRQAIAWGSARMINPTDIIAPFAYTELDTEDRIGVDAVRVRIPIGFLGECDFGYVAGQDFRFATSAIFLRGRYNFLKTDVSAMGVAFQENLMVGIDVARSIGESGFWCEAGYVFVDALAEDGNGAGNDYLRLSTGLDHSLGPNTYGFIEYHFNQAGSNNADDYSLLLSETAYREGSTYLLGRHYLIPGITHQLTPLISGSMNMLVNLGDPSFSITPVIEYNIAPDIYLSAGAYLGLGKTAADLSDNGDTAGGIFRSEFGSYPEIYFASFRVYF